MYLAIFDWLTRPSPRTPTLAENVASKLRISDAAGQEVLQQLTPDQVKEVLAGELDVWFQSAKLAARENWFDVELTNYNEKHVAGGLRVVIEDADTGKQEFSYIAMGYLLGGEQYMDLSLPFTANLKPGMKQIRVGAPANVLAAAKRPVIVLPVKKPVI